jgi:hypothetical protein
MPSRPRDGMSPTDPAMVPETQPLDASPPDTNKRPRNDELHELKRLALRLNATEGLSFSRIKATGPRL